MKKVLQFIIPISLLTVFILWTILVKTIDVQYINGVGYLGFYSFNTRISSAVTAFNRTEAFDKLTDIGLYLSFAVVLAFAVIGLVELIKRKSLKKVDLTLYLLLATYVITVFMYFVFEIMKVNYSPLSMEGDLKASYPSSHLLFFSVFLITGVIALFDYVEANKFIKIGTYSISGLVVFGYAFARLFSNQHYFSDIIGSLLLSATIIALFISLKKQFNAQNAANKEDLQ